MKRRISLLFLIFLATFTLTTPGFADGMLRSRLESSTSSLEQEDSQTCAIRFVDGIETMVLSINIDKENMKSAKKLVWLFPVPSTPEKIQADIMKNFPEFVGTNVKRKAKGLLDTSLLVAFSTQVHFFPISMFNMFGGVLGSEKNALETQIHQSIEKYGIKTQIVTAKDKLALIEYMNTNDMPLDNASKKAIDEYIGKDFSFAVTWISDFNEYFSAKESNSSKTESLGVEIKFPTAKIYYPLKPTSIYGSTVIPTNVYVCDYVEPKLYPQIYNDSNVNYFNGYVRVSSGTYKEFFKDYPLHPEINALRSIEERMQSRRDSILNSHIKYNASDDYYMLKFTSVKINTPSQNFVEDLWFEQKSPLLVTISELILNIPVFLFPVFFIILFSIISTILSGYVFLRKYTSMKTLLVLSFTTLFTSLGHGYAVYKIILEKLPNSSFEESCMSTSRKLSLEKIIHNICTFLIALFIVVIDILFMIILYKMAFDSISASIIFHFAIIFSLFLLLILFNAGLLIILKKYEILKFNILNFNRVHKPEYRWKAKLLIFYLLTHTIIFTSLVFLTGIGLTLIFI